MNPSDGGALGSRTAYVSFASSDDHVVGRLRILVVGSVVATTECGGIVYECQASYRWSIRRVRRQHTATFESADAMGNVSTHTSTFTVN